MKKVSFYTLGCKVNQYETNAMIQKFQEAGYEIISMNEEIADIVLVKNADILSDFLLKISAFYFCNKT